MAEQEKKKTFKTRKPNHRAYPARERNPERVLSRILQSSGYAEAYRYAKKYGLWDRLSGMYGSSLLRRKMEHADEPDRVPTRLRCGRALRRRMIRNQQASGKAFLASPDFQASLHAEALVMDASLNPSRLKVRKGKPAAKKRVKK